MVHTCPQCYAQALPAGLRLSHYMSSQQLTQLVTRPYRFVMLLWNDVGGEHCIFTPLDVYIG